MSARQAPFKSGARTVALYATVTGPDGRLVPDLNRDDFEIYDNGKLQSITVFANDVQPITIVVMLDRSGSMKANNRLVEAAGEAFVERLLPADKARIGSFAARIQVDPRDFTSDKDELVRILRTELQPDGPTPLWNALNVGMTSLLRQEGRRVVLVFTDGVDMPMNFSTHNVSLRDAMKRAQEEDVMVYAIGLEGHVPYGGRRAPTSGGRMGGFGGRRGGGGSMIAQKPDEGLAKIAMETGGGYFELTNTRRPVVDLRDRGRRAAPPVRAGLHACEARWQVAQARVRLKRPELVARARKSYVASIDREPTTP